MSVTFLSTRTIKLPMGEQTVRLPTIIHCYLLMHCLEDGPVAIMANVVAHVESLMSGATVPHMGKLATSVRVLIISKQFVVQRLQPRWHRALTEARSHTRRDMVPWGATAAKAKEVANNNRRRRHLHDMHATEIFGIQPSFKLSLFFMKLSELVGYF